MKTTLSFDRFMLGLLLIFSALHSATLTAAPSCAYTMGWEQWKPYQYLDESNNLTGLDIELVESILSNMQCELSLKNKPWKRLLVEAEQGSMDIVASASITAERQKWGYFTEAYRYESRVLFVLKGDAERQPLNNLNDVVSTNFRVGIERGAYNGPEFEKLMNNESFSEQIKVVRDESINVKKLLSKRIDGYIGDAISGSQLLRDMKQLDKIEIHPLKIYSSGVYVIFSKLSSSEESIKAFNLSLANLKKNGKHQSIIDKYLE